jgi:hypothetical protein
MQGCLIGKKKSRPFLTRFAGPGIIFVVLMQYSFSHTPVVMKVNKYLPFAILYFFFNSIGLPFGLTWTALLAPLFYIWIWYKRKKEILVPFALCLAPFIALHIAIVGVDEKSYFFSLLNLALVYVSCQAVYTFFTYCNDPEAIFRKILILNFVACLVAIPLYFSPYWNIVWDEQVLAGGVNDLRRLKLFVYEPSYYALVFTPVFCFFLLQYLFGQNRIRGSLLLLMLFLPYILSFSMGVIASLVLAGIITWLFYFTRLTSKRRILNGLVYSGALLGSVLVMMVLFFRHNPIFLRIGNILRGEDTSGKGRTVDAFVLARKLLDEKNEVWGIGVGQIKILGENIIRSYYLYNIDFTVAIPNAAAETLAIFGWAGLSIRLFIELFLFFYTRVWNNYFRLLLFFFVFIYQFTGSFITNIAEYVIWILAFTNVFKQFNVRKERES